MIGIAKVDEIDAAWPLVAPMLQQCIDNCGDDLSMGELWQMCRSGNAFLVFDSVDGKLRMVSVFQFQRWAGASVLRCIAMAGEQMDAWSDELAKFIKRMMADGNTDRLVFEGREWAAHFRKHGHMARKLRSTFEVRL
jgi:hypothetical protein